MNAAIELGASNKILGIYIAILEDDNYETKDDESLKFHPVVNKLDQFTKCFTNEQLVKLVSFLKEWNTNARYCFVSQALISSIFRSIGIDRIRSIPEINETVESLMVYSERHFQRIDRYILITFIIIIIIIITTMYLFVI